MRRGESEADMRLVANFVAAATVLQQDAPKMANEIMKSRSLEHFVVQVVMRRCCCHAMQPCSNAFQSNLMIVSGESSAALPSSSLGANVAVLTTFGVAIDLFVILNQHSFVVKLRNAA